MDGSSLGEVLKTGVDVQKGIYDPSMELQTIDINCRLEGYIEILKFGEVSPNETFLWIVIHFMDRKVGSWFGSFKGENFQV